ncbi:MAG: hypothetical protein IJE43_19255 [Alphaproteobacteria bacterium]|nr:hypothetical protein [Alphaproteobacteria bacterium]
MYTLIPLTKNEKMHKHDFVFSDFQSFYKVASSLTVKLQGKWYIAIKTKDIKAVSDFLAVSEKYEHMVIEIFLPQSQVDYLSMRQPSIIIKDKIKPYEQFTDLCSKRNLLFEKNVCLLVYNAIEHDIDSMEHAVNMLYDAYGPQNAISEKMISKYFIVNKIVYPRSVLLDYLWLGRWREVKLKKCLECMGNDIVLYAMINNIEKLFEAKVTFFKTGQANNLVKSIDTRRLLLLYRILVVERGKFKDIAILLKLYERGLSCYDFTQR